MLHVYGIPNCQTVKKARVWLEERGIEYQFHNFKTETPSAPLLTSWLQSVPLTALINKRGTTWRKLSTEEQQAAEQADTAIALMQQHSSVIKRPVMVNEADGAVWLGFDAGDYAQRLGA